MRGVCIEILTGGERRYLSSPVWVTKNRNGVIRTPSRVHALGVGDGETVWSLGALDGYPEAKIITRAEYEERPGIQEEDPELNAEAALTIIMGGAT